MRLNCRFSLCEWSGSEDEIFDHLETNHKKYLREPKGNLYFDLSFDELQQETFVLCTPKGLYCWRQNIHHPRSNGIDFGLFHIGESEPVEYVLKLGLKSEGYGEYWGPYKSTIDKVHDSNQGEEEYHLKFDFEYLEALNETMLSRCLRLYFGEYDDIDDNPQSVEWQAANELATRLCLDHFTCPICFKFIQHDARFCENKHFVCLHCFEEMQKRKKLACPVCRGIYLYDCKDNDVERLLRMLIWPDVTEIDADKIKLPS